MLMFYNCPKPGERVRWSSAQPNPVIRFGQGELTLLFLREQPIEVEQWLSGPVELGVFGLDAHPLTPAARQAAQVPAPPVLIVGLAGQLLAAPICLPELADESLQAEWLNSKGPLTLRLVMLEPDEEPNVARVVAGRRYWNQGWVRAQAQIRRQLEALLLDVASDQAGEVQHAGRELVALLGPARLLEHATYRLSDLPATALVTAAE